MQVEERQASGSCSVCLAPEGIASDSKWLQQQWGAKEWAGEVAGS